MEIVFDTAKGTTGKVEISQKLKASLV